MPFPAGFGAGRDCSGQALFLALTAKPEDSSPTARGLFVREQFLCQHVPDPPAGVNTNLPPVTEAKPQTNRDRMSEHATNPSCATLPQADRPDRLRPGEVRRRRRQARQVQAAVLGAARRRRRRPARADEDRGSRYRRHGYVAGIPDSQFSSPSQLGAVLAKSAQCQECMVKQYFRYTAGRLETPADRPVIRQMSG